MKMNREKKTHKPGRLVLFGNRHDDDRHQGNTGAEIEEDAIVLSTAAKAQLELLLDALKAVKKGDLSVRLQVRKDGVMGEIAEAFNDVIGLNENMANEVIRVSREVGVEGKLGAQAEVPGVAGTWKELTGNVNMLAANLTNQSWKGKVYR
jgi:methyl-accepting chemotaxis protein